MAARCRTGLAVLVTSALVGTLLAVSAGPAVGIGDKKVTYPARYSACVGDATEAAGFVDTAGTTAELAADCLAYYGITLGTAPDVFSPEANVTRVQMALFLARAADPAGILLPEALPYGFTDLTGLPVDFRYAIDQIAELGIMEGRQPKLFVPDDLVTREDMAVHLAAFLDVAEVGPGGHDIEKVKPDDDVFADIEDISPLAYEAVRDLYEMGITRGTSPTTFSPEGHVTRAQMAVFITRALAHTNARPAGPSIQVDKRGVYTGGSMQVAISVRSATFRPLSESYVDVFTAGSRADAFNEDGRCTTSVSSRHGEAACVIDQGDRTLSRLGNLTFNEYPSGKPLMLWAWTGGLGDSYDEDRVDAAVIDIGEVEGAAAFRVTDDMKDHARLLHFGNAVTFTFELVDRKGSRIPHAGVEMRLYTRLTDSKGKRTSSSRIEATDHAGRIRVAFSESDPSSATGETVSLDIDARGDLPFEDKTTLLVLQNDGADSLAADAQVHWSDEKAKSTTLTLTQHQAYHQASDIGDGVANTIRATLVDQYGDPINKERITFNSDDPLGVPNFKTRETNSQGVASLSYLRDSADPSLERIGAITASGRALRARDVYHYWGTKPAADETGQGGVAVADPAANTVVVHEGSDPLKIWVLVYSTTDHFFVVKQSKADSNDRTDPAPIPFENFEATVEEGDILSFYIAAPANTVDTFTLTNIVSEPDAPGPPSVSVTSTSITISWNRPTNDGGADISRYQARWRCVSTDSWTETSELLVSNLVSGLNHAVTANCSPIYAEAQVRALNEINDDWGPWSGTGSGRG